jgi:ABC-2 type transport system ATP-binding protein
MDAGRVLAQGTPAEVRRRAYHEGEREPTMEEAFIAIVEDAREHNGSERGAAA